MEFFLDNINRALPESAPLISKGVGNNLYFVLNHFSPHPLLCFLNEQLRSIWD